jgi:branched-chain amino acid transport system permease protein
MSSKCVHIFGFAAAIIAIQIFTQITDSSFHLTQLTMTAYYSLLVIGLCMLIGYAGQISLGHAGFFAIGGYISAFLTTHNFTSVKGQPIIALCAQLGLLVGAKDPYGADLLTFHPWPACIIAVTSVLIVAYVIGGPVLKLKGHYLAMATLGFGIIIYRIVLGTSSLGAADGLSGVPGFTILPGVTIGGSGSGKILNYYVAWSILIAGITLLLNLISSRVGRALSAIHGAEDAAEAMGIPTANYKLRVFVLSAGFAAVAGILLTHYNGSIGPSEASVMKSVRYVAIVAIGGMTSIWGAVSMSLILNYFSLRGSFGTYDDAVFGGILILIMLFAPDGLIRTQLLGDLKAFFKRSTGKEIAS